VVLVKPRLPEALSLEKKRLGSSRSILFFTFSCPVLQAHSLYGVAKGDFPLFFTLHTPPTPASHFTKTCCHETCANPSFEIIFLDSCREREYNIHDFVRFRLSLFKGK